MAKSSKGGSSKAAKPASKPSSAAGTKVTVPGGRKG